MMQAYEKGRTQSTAGLKMRNKAPIRLDYLHLSPARDADLSQVSGTGLARCLGLQNHFCIAIAGILGVAALQVE